MWLTYAGFIHSVEHRQETAGVIETRLLRSAIRVEGVDGSKLRGNA